MEDRRAALRQGILDAQDALQAKLTTMSDEDWLKPSPNEGWSEKDNLAHLCTIEERLRGQVQHILRGTPLPSETVHEFNARKVIERRDWSVARLLDELA